MATLQIDIPDALIPDLTQALALRMQMSPDQAAAAIAQKVIAGQATTDAEKRTLARSFMREQARTALADWRAQKAAETTRTQTAGEWVS